MDVLIITGGTGGLGSELVRGALDRGLFVVDLSRDPGKVQQMNERYAGGMYLGLAGDITDEEFVERAVARAASLGEIRWLINNAQQGVFGAADSFRRQDIDASLGGLAGMMLVTAAVLRITGEKDLSIVNILSTAALSGKKNETLYCAAKWGGRGYTEALKATYKGTSVRVSAVYPGGMDTGFWEESRDYVSEEKAAGFMRPSVVAEQILGLLDSPAYISQLVIERN